MAITQSTPQSYLVTTAWNGSVYTWSQAYTSDADVLVLVLAGGTGNPNAVTYGGVALTLRAERNDGDAGETKIYDLISPPTGANNLVITNNTSANTYRVVASSLSGVDTAVAATTATDFGYKTTLSCAPVTVADGFVIDAINIWDTFTAVAGAGQTATTSLEASSTNYTTYTSTETATTTSTTMSWTLTGAANRVSQAAIAYAPSTAVVNPILTDILVDDENAGAVLASETGLRVHVYDVDGGTLLLSVTNATTDANGRFTIDDDLVGSVASTPFVVIKLAAGRTICGTMTVTDGNA